MNEIIITTGCPASGKSTWAKEFMKTNSSFVRFSRDDVRAMLNGGNPWVHFQSENKDLINNVENSVTEVQKAFIVSNLRQGRDIIVDETNVKSRTFKDVCRLLDNYNFNVFVEERAFYVDLEEALRRDRLRDPKVGDEVVVDFFNRLGGEKFKYYICKTKKFNELPILSSVNFMLPVCIISDIDGTIALFGDKNPYDRDFRNDIMNFSVSRILKNELNKNTTLIFVSGRNEKNKDVTIKWLEDYGFNKFELYMRKENDFRNDVIVKYEIYRDNIHNKYNVLSVIDDRLKVCRLWYRLGLPLFKVGNPDGDF